MIRFILSAVVGIWLMAAPAVLGYSAPAADADRIVGPLIASFALIAAWEIGRSLRWVNVALGAWLIFAPLVLGHPVGAAVNSVACGALTMGLSWGRGKMKHAYAGGWRSLAPRRA